MKGREPLTYSLGEKIAGALIAVFLLLVDCFVLSAFTVYFGMLWREAFP